jgi:uncharacterized repeat protein (TIGR03803 family)
MNYVRHATELFRLGIAFVLVFTIAGTAIPAHAQTYKVLYVAPGAPGVQNPLGAIAQGRNGDLYSVSSNGGTFYGTIFRFTPAGATKVINDIGYFPWGGITLGTDGNLYGQDGDGGDTGNCGLAAGGQVYKVKPSGVVTVLHNFTGNGDGCNPQAEPIEGTNGVFYGTTPNVGNGTVYSVTSSGKFATLHTFTGADGQGVWAPLVQGSDGNFYGDTVAGGSSGDGVIFKMTPTGTVTVLHNFTGAPDGAQAYYGLIQAKDGNFYGVAVAGGTFYGTIFKITPGGVFTVLHTFTDGPTDGSGPSSSLMQATDAKLYGVTSGGGTTGGGTIYSITTGGKYSVLYNFADSSTTGYNPAAPLRQHTNGKLYGDAYYGGNFSSCNCGVIYSLDMKLKPFVSLVSTSGKEGAKIGVLGQGFSASSVVMFGAVQATTSKLSGTTFISATVPTGAETGAVTVTTGSTVLTSAQTFRVTPTLISFNPPSGPVGTPVAITGTGLTQTTKVTFGGVPATTFAVNSDGRVTANVPTGAVTGKIGITTKGGKATSQEVFTVTK